MISRQFLRLAGLLLVPGIPSLLSAQQPHRVFTSATIGLAATSHDPSSYFGSTATSEGIRLGFRMSPAWGATLEARGRHVSAAQNVPAYLCPNNVDCVPPGGPVTTTTIGLGFYRMKDLSAASWTFGIFPGWTWYNPKFTARGVNAATVEFGSTIALGRPGHLRPLVEVRYQRAVSGGAIVKSVVEMSIGVSWH